MTEPLAEDLLHGVKRIAAYIGVTPRRAYYLLECGEIPGFRLGRIWCARRSEIDARCRALDTA